MSLKVCAESGCPELATNTRCPAHTKAKDKQRGTRQERGYDATHAHLRATWAPKVAAGQVTCWRCHKPIQASEPWDLGHDDQDRSTYRGPEHQACNRATSSRR